MKNKFVFVFSIIYLENIYTNMETKNRESYYVLRDDSSLL